MAGRDESVLFLRSEVAGVVSRRGSVGRASLARGGGRRLAGLAVTRCRAHGAVGPGCGLGARTTRCRYALGAGDRGVGERGCCGGAGLALGEGALVLGPLFAKLSSALIGGAFGGALAARVETVAFDLALAALYAGSIHRARLVSSACCCGDGHAVRKDADRGDVIVEGNKRGGSTDIEGESCVAKPEAASRVQGRQSVTFKEASGSSRMKQRADRKPQGQQLARGSDHKQLTRLPTVLGLACRLRRREAANPSRRHTLAELLARASDEEGALGAAPPMVATA